MPRTERFHIELPADLASYVHEQIGRGSLASEGEVFSAALRALREKQERAAQISDIQRRIEESLSDPRPSLTDEEVAAHFRRRAAADDQGNRA